MNPFRFAARYILAGRFGDGRAWTEDEITDIIANAVSRAYEHTPDTEESLMLPDANSYHVVLATGSERDIKADTVTVTDGVLAFFRKDEELLVAYAPDAWVGVELERRDDTG